MPGIASDGGTPDPSAPLGSCPALDAFDYSPILNGTPRTLAFSVQTLALSGHVIINGGDLARPTVPFSIDWGDGTAGTGFFPFDHSYVTVSRNYVVSITGHYADGHDDTVSGVVRFTSPVIIPEPVDDTLRVSVLASPEPLATRLYPPPTGLTGFADSALAPFSRSGIEYLLTRGAELQYLAANRDVVSVEGGFRQVVLADPNFSGGMYSLWFTTPVALATGMSEGIFLGQISSVFHEMGHNVTLNTPATFQFGGRVDGPANAIYSETLAQVFQHFTLYELIRSGGRFGLDCGVREDLAESALSSMTLLRSTYDDYVRAGSPFASWNAPGTPEDETFGTFMTLAFTFFKHQSMTGESDMIPALQRMMHVLQQFDAEGLAAYDPSDDTPAGATYRSTLLVAAVSAGVSADLRDEFRLLNFPIDDAVFTRLLSH